MHVSQNCFIINDLNTMKKLSHLILLCCLAAFFACEEPPIEYELIQPDKTAPGEVQNLVGSALPGAARLSWDLPGDEDFSFVTIAYEDQGEMVEVQTTDTTATIDGLLAQEYVFNIKTVDENNNTSEGVTVSVTPEEPIDVTATLDPFVSGIFIDWSLPDPSEFIFVIVSYLDDAGTVVENRIPVDDVMPDSVYADGFTIDGLSWRDYEISVRLVLSSGDLSRGVTLEGRPEKAFILSAANFYSTNNSTIFHDAGLNTIVDGNLANQSVFVGLPGLGAPADPDSASFIITSENGLIELSKLTFNHTRKHENGGDPKADQQYPAAPAHINILTRAGEDDEWVLVKDHTFSNFAAPAVEGNDPDFLERMKAPQEVLLDAPVNCTQVKIVVLTNMHHEHGVDIYAGNKDNITLGEIELDAVFVN